MEQFEATPDQSLDKFQPLPDDLSEPERQLPARLVVVETISHQEMIAQPQQTRNKFIRKLETHEEPYQRKFVATEQWQILDFGWLASLGPGMVVLLNREGEAIQRVPTPEQLTESKARMIKVGLRPESGVPIVDFCRVRPGESCRFEPLEAITYFVRCAAGEAPCTVIAYPR